MTVGAVTALVLMVAGLLVSSAPASVVGESWQSDTDLLEWLGLEDRLPPSISCDGLRSLRMSFSQVQQQLGTDYLSSPWEDVPAQQDRVYRRGWSPSAVCG
jgi:hypothetical protein